MNLLLIPVLTVALTVLLLSYVYRFIFSRRIESPRIVEIAEKIRLGTNSYLKRQARVILPSIPALTIIIYFFLGIRMSLTFVVGAVLSLISAYVVMRTVVRVHGRVVEEACASPRGAFNIAFLGGSIMGLSVPAISLAGLTILYAVTSNPSDLVGFGFGASLTALFAQVGGGIFTKAADIGADIVGKVELGIPEDDPRNPAVIADLVGDNVGDCAGRGSDLFQSFSGDIITGMIMGVAFIPWYGAGAVIFPLLLQCAGNLASLIGIVLVRKLGVNPSQAITWGLAWTAILSIAGAYVLTIILIGDITIFYAAVSGLVAVILSIFTAQYYTSYKGRPVTAIAKASQRGAALNLITGLGYGLQAPILPVCAVLGAAVFSFIVSGSSLYAIAIANIGTDLMLGYIMSADAFGPIVDNANGVAEMSGQNNVGEGLSTLDAVGNTMKAYTKALSMTTGTLTAFAIFITFFEFAGIRTINLMQPFNIAALFVGVTLSFMVASLIIGSTAKTAQLMVDEVRRQWRRNIDASELNSEPDYARCIDISTKNALREMALPGLLAVVPPVATGLIFGSETLIALLIGVTVSAVALAVFFNNIGASFDNAKKLIESGLYGGKGSETHKAAIVGDTVGDPMKDVAGPSLIIYMKLVGMTALLLLPLLLRQ